MDMPRDMRAGIFIRLHVALPSWQYNHEKTMETIHMHTPRSLGSSTPETRRRIQKWIRLSEVRGVFVVGYLIIKGVATCDVSAALADFGL